MTWFVDDTAATGAVVALCRSRALGAGVDPFAYDALTADLVSLRDWLGTFAEAGLAHGSRAAAAEAAGHTATARAEWRSAAACSHIANTLPHPDVAAAATADRYAAQAARRYAELSGTVHALSSSDPIPFEGELRLPERAADAPPVAVIVPGLDSGRAEFLDLADAMLARHVAVATVDGPGQGSLVDRTPHAAYSEVTSGVIDALNRLDVVDGARVALVGLSLGGLYAMLGAAADPRVGVVATVSGAYPFPAWEDMPAFAVDTLTLRCGSEQDAARFTADITTPDLAASVHQPMLVVTGGADMLPTPEQAARTVDRAADAELLLVEGGDHLLGNVRWRWLDRTADWIAGHLAAG